MEIRDCELSHLREIAAIYGAAVRDGTASFELEPPDQAEMARRRAAILDGGYPYFVAVEDGRIAGYAYAGQYRTRPAYRSTVENSVYVAPDLQRRGVARLLLAALIEATAARGFRQMIAIIGDSGNEASIRLHAALGFEPVGTLRAVGWKHGRWLDTVLMQRPLGSGAETPSELARPAGTAGA